MRRARRVLQHWTENFFFFKDACDISVENEFWRVKGDAGNQLGQEL